MMSVEASSYCQQFRPLIFRSCQCAVWGFPRRGAVCRFAASRTCFFCFSAHARLSCGTQCTSWCKCNEPICLFSVSLGRFATMFFSWWSGVVDRTKSKTKDSLNNWEPFWAHLSTRQEQTEHTSLEASSQGVTKNISGQWRRG